MSLSESFLKDISCSPRVSETVVSPWTCGLDVLAFGFPGPWDDRLPDLTVSVITLGESGKHHEVSVAADSHGIFSFTPLHTSW